MKRAVLIVVCLLLLVIPAMGCVDDAAAPAKPLATQEFVNTQDNTIKSELKALIDARATMAYVDQRFAAVPASAGYTKSEVDALKVDLQSKITTLESKVTALEAKIASVSVMPTTPATPTTGKVTWSVWKEPGTPIYVAGSYTWWLKIVNGFAEYKKVYVSVNIGATATIVGDVTTASTYFYSPDLPVRPTDTSPSGKFSMSFVPTDGINCSLISGNSQGYSIVKGNSEIVIPITLVLAYTADASQFTEIVWNVTAMNYP